MLNIYTDLSLLEHGEGIEMLIPFIGLHEYDKDPRNVIFGRFDELLGKGKEHMRLVEDVRKADVALLPIRYEFRNKRPDPSEFLRPFLEKARQAGKKTIVFTGHDIGNLEVPIENAIVFDGAMNKSAQPANRYSWPHFFEDYLSRYKENKMTFREKSEKPVIGFSGYSPPLALRFGKEKIISALKLAANYAGLMKQFPHLSSHSYRSRALIGLQKSRFVSCNFRIKPNFGFGPAGLNTGATNESNHSFRVNFIDNILNSDYTLCVRGIGNNSVRFFETMCCGRIPIFVNTDSVLPFDHLIDWKKNCVWVEEKDIDNIGTIVAEFHNNISERDFQQMQQYARDIWQEYLSPLGFFKNIHRFI